MFPARDLWVRGTDALLVIALGLLALSVAERSRPHVVFATGFLVVAPASCLYNDANILDRLGMGDIFRANAAELPNIIIPGWYLFFAGIGFWFAGHRARRWPGIGSGTHHLATSS